MRAVGFLLIVLNVACHRPDVAKKIADLETRQSKQLEQAVKDSLALGPKREHINQLSPGPRAGAAKDELFPPKVGDFERRKLSPSAQLPEFGLKEAGEAAVYESNMGTLEVFAFRIDLPKNRERRKAVVAKQEAGDYEYSDFGAGGDVWNSGYRTKANEQGIYWCNKAWFFFVRSHGVVNAGVFLDAYVDAVFVDGRPK